jgi:excisionase family DNA binding protein
MKLTPPPAYTLDRFQEFTVLMQARMDTLEALLADREPAASSSKPVTTKALCTFLGVTEPTVIRWRKKGVIPFYTVGTAVRYDLTKVIAALETKKKK